MPVAMNFILPRTDEFAQGNVRSIMIISMGFIFIAGMGSAMTGMMSLVEEKEKKTLRVLMTSTVTSLEFLIATLLPTVVLLMLLSYLLIPLSGMSFTDLSLLKYGIVSLSTIVSGSIIGFISGIFAKNSSEATAYSIFPLMILIFVPFTVIEAPPIAFPLLSVICPRNSKRRVVESCSITEAEEEMGETAELNGLLFVSLWARAWEGVAKAVANSATGMSG